MTACEQILSQDKALLPDDAALTRGLSRLLGGGVMVQSRRECDYSSTFPAELVTCALRDGSQVRLFIKYSAGENNNSYGHRGGVAYEAAVYQQLLEPLCAPVSRCFGLYGDSSSGCIGLVLEDLGNGVGVHWEAWGLSKAAQWIGHLHADGHRYLATHRPACLKAYTAEYFRGWVSRTVAFANDLTQVNGWLGRVARQAIEMFALLCDEASATLIHGEYYHGNLLHRDGKVFPVDWESAARSSGAIDLAALIEGWDEPRRQACIESYRLARWPPLGEVPRSFDEALDAASLYLHFRWLGERPEWTGQPGNRWRFERLREFAERRGLI